MLHFLAKSFSVVMDFTSNFCTTNMMQKGDGYFIFLYYCYNMDWRMLGLFMVALGANYSLCIVYSYFAV